MHTLIRAVCTTPDIVPMHYCNMAKSGVRVYVRQIFERGSVHAGYRLSVEPVGM